MPWRWESAYGTSSPWEVAEVPDRGVGRGGMLLLSASQVVNQGYCTAERTGEKRTGKLRGGGS